MPTVSAALPSLRPIILPVSGLLFVQLIAGMSGTIVATSIPTLMADLHGPDSHATWLVAATILTNSATTPIWGKLGDRFNPKFVLLCAIGIFILGTGLAIFSMNTTALIAARSVQGAGLGGIFSCIAIVVASLVTARQRGRINSWLSISMTVAQLTAPVVGGVLATAPLLGWRWSFVAIFPSLVIAFAIIVFTLKLPPRAPRDTLRADYAGAVLIALSVITLLVCVTIIGESGWGDPMVLITAPLTIVLVLSSVFVERRAADPIIPFFLLRRRTPALAVVGSFCAGTSLFVGTVFTSEYLQTSLRMSPAESGVMFIPMAVATALAALIAGRYMSMTGRIKSVLVVGFVCMVAGAGILAMIALAPIACAIAGTVLSASGLGLLLQNLILAAQNSVDHEHVGTITGTAFFASMVGGSIALVCSGSLLNALVHSAELGGATVPDAYAMSVPWVFVLTLAAVVVGLVATLAMPRMKLRNAL